MRKFLSLALISLAFQLHAQHSTETPFSSLRGFFKMKDPLSSGWMGMTPALTSFGGSEINSSYTYWAGSSYTSHSENGRFRSTHYFDVQGRLRESRASVSLKKKGPLSHWRVQFSPQRHRPLFIYTIP